MSSAATGPETQRAWREALELAGREGDGRVLVERLLDIVRVGAAASGVALYTGDDCRLAREIVVGAGDFPDAVDANGGDSSNLERLAFSDSALLLHAAEAPSELDNGLRLALAAAIRNLRLERRLKREKFEVNYRGVELESLYDVGLAIAGTLNLDDLSEEILLRAVSLLDARLGALYLVEDGEFRLDGTFGGEARPSVAIDDPAMAALLEGDSGVGEELIPGAEHLLAVPIGTARNPRGLLAVADKESRHGVGPFERSDERSLGMLANQAAIALENAHLHRQALEKERLEREAELAAEIQRRILPDRLPEIEGLELTGWNRPAREVGGDYYDLLPIDDKLGAVVADVTGKGMPAALMVSTLHSALRLLLDRESLGPDLIARLNRHVYESSAPNKFITLLVALLDPETGGMSYVNAGHNPGFLVRASGDIEELPTGGMPLGLFPGGAFEGRELTLEIGDLLCIYSDGITECASPEDEEFGEEKLCDLLLAARDEPLRAIVRQIDEAVTSFAAGLPQGDDQTLVLLRKT